MNKQIDRQKQNAETIFNTRSLENDYRTLLPVLKVGMRILDVGCGTGAISAGIAKEVGPSGKVIGIDNTITFIENGKSTFKAVKNLELQHIDLMDYESEEQFDLIVSARVLQWLSHPVEALEKMMRLLKPGGMISILDYNHEQLVLEPEPPKSMQDFYQRWLQWRADAGMNNHIAEDLPRYFETVGLRNIQINDSSERYDPRMKNFKQKVSIWAKVARSTQLQEEGYISETERLKAIDDYLEYVEKEVVLMVMKLKEVRGIKQK